MDQLRYFTEDISSLIGCLHVISTSNLGKSTCIWSCRLLTFQWRWIMTLDVFQGCQRELRMILQKLVRAYIPMITNYDIQTYIKIEPISIKVNWFSRRKFIFSCSNAEYNEHENWLLPWCHYRIYRYYDYMPYLQSRSPF